MLPNPQRRLNSRTRKKLFNEHVRVHGRKCRWRGCKATENLVVDDINNDGMYTFETTQLLCRSHNSEKNPRGFGRYNPKRVLSLKDIATLEVTSASMAKNIACEKPWRTWVKTTIKRDGYITEGDAIEGGAERFDFSPQTARVYLSKMISSQGELMIDKERKVIVFKKEREASRSTPTNTPDARSLASEAVSKS